MQYEHASIYHEISAGLTITNMYILWNFPSITQSYNAQLYTYGVCDS